MKNRALVLAAIVVLVCFAVAVADLNGNWKGLLHSPNGPLEITFDFHVDGEKLTGTVTNTYGTEQITDGTVKGEAISFAVLAGGGEFRITYKGAVAGDDLKFHVTIGDIGEGIWSRSA